MLLIVLLVGALAWSAGAAIQQARANQALIAAVKGSNATAAIAELDAGADANARDHGGLFPSNWRHVREYVDRLWGRATAPDDDYEPTALMTAFECQRVPNTSICITPPENVALVEALLARGANISARDADGRTALSLAIEDRHDNSAKLLLDRGADVHGGAAGADPVEILTEAAAIGDAPIVEQLLARGAKLNGKDEYGNTPLGCAAKCGQSAVLKMLLRNGAKIDAMDDDGWTALMQAAKVGESESVKFLISEGADVNIKDKRGFSALGLAVRGMSKDEHQMEAALGFSWQKPYLEIVRLLKKAGAR